MTDHTYAGYAAEQIIASVPRPEPVAWQPGLRPPSVFKTSDAGRQFVANYFASGLRRHDFSRYIKSRLAADFACALADGLHAMLAAAPEAPQVAVQDRRAEACLTAMDHISTETLESFNRAGIKFDATRGYAEELEAEIATLREQNAALYAKIAELEQRAAMA